MGEVHHAIDYVEITVTDVTAAKAFYGAAFGWEFTDYGPGYAGIRGPGGRARSAGWRPVRRGRWAGRS